jgi:hypothetical protein
VKLFQQALHPSEMQRSAGQPLSQGPDVVRQRKGMPAQVMDYVQEVSRHVMDAIDSHVPHFSQAKHRGHQPNHGRGISI